MKKISIPTLLVLIIFGLIVFFIYQTIIDLSPHKDITLWKENVSVVVQIMIENPQAQNNNAALR